MTVKTTLSFTERHHQFLIDKVGEGVFASQSAAVASALEQMIRDEEERALALRAVADTIRARLDTPREDYVSADETFAKVRSRLKPDREA